MKSRKTLRHHELVQETIKQLTPRYTPSLPEVKKRIDELIALEYMERDELDRKVYKYIA